MAGRLTSISVKQGAGHNLMTPAEFVRLPVSQRIQLLMEHKVTFLDEDGKPIPPHDAVAQLPTATAVAVKR
jgi:hypothetical protein